MTLPTRESLQAAIEDQERSLATLRGWLASMPAKTQEAAPLTTPAPASHPDQLSPHFTLDEFTRSTSAAHMGDANRPTPGHLKNLQHLAREMEAVRAFLGKPIRVTSAYRNPKVNAAVGGSKTSAHAMGLACDFHVSGMSDFQAATKLAEGVRSGALKVDQLIYEPGRCVHWGCARPGGQARGQVTTQRKVGAPLEPGVNR